MAAQQGCSNGDRPDQRVPAPHHLSQPGPLQQTPGAPELGDRTRGLVAGRPPPTPPRPRLPWHCQAVRGQRLPLPWPTPPQGCWEAELMPVIQAGPKGWRGMVRRAWGGTCLHPTHQRNGGEGASLALTTLCSASPRQGPDWGPSVQNLFPSLLSLHLKSEMPPLAIHSFGRQRGIAQKSLALQSGRMYDVRPGSVLY